MTLFVNLFDWVELNAAPLMHHRWPVGRGPSPKTWPRWPPHVAQLASRRGTSSLKSVWTATASRVAASEKLGQPVPDSNWSSARNSSASQPAQRYTPSDPAVGCAYGLLPGASVPARRSTR